MNRAICVLIGYLFVNFLTAEVVSRHVSRESTLLMLQRHFSGLKNIQTGKEPRKDLLKSFRKKDS